MSVLLHCNAQLPYDYGFSREFTVTVRDSAGNVMPFAWAGGLNSCQFSEIDLDGDGTYDLVVFDKSGDRILTFINNGTSGATDFSYNYLYQKYFPKLESWVQFKDYNCDGKPDIFTYTSAGIKVFKNVSATSPAFQLVVNMILSDMGMGSSNILVTNDDFPAIEDIDGDGDLDILVFFGLGNFVELHNNRSVELTGGCDSLVYRREENCWGDFAESSSSNHIFLNVACPWKCGSFKSSDDGGSKQIEHVGSTMLALDMDGDNDKDLLLGDVDYPEITALYNGGTSDSAHMTAVDSVFPSYDVPVSLPSFNVATMADINNDGKKDLLVSPFYSNLVMPQGYKSVWMYKNTGSSASPVFSFQQDDFLQSGMIDVGTGAYPVLFDADADGLTDLLISDYGYLDSTWMDNGYRYSKFRSKVAYYRNTGTLNAPSFRLITRDYQNLSALGLMALYPAFGDLDDDGDADMIVGDSKGKLCYYENTAGAGNPAVFSLVSSNYQSIDVGDFAAPAITDLDGDSLNDLVIGKKNGMLTYYKNTGTPASAVFSKITDSLGRVDVTDHLLSYTGFSTPGFFRDTAGFLKLFVGSESGKIFYYKDIEANLGGKFTASDSMLIYTDQDTVTGYIKDGIRSSAAVTDINNDGYPDLFTGNFSGGLGYYSGREPVPFSSVENERTPVKTELSLFPNPASEKVFLRFGGDFGNQKLYFVITNLLGQQVATKYVYGKASYEFDTRAFPKGMYVLTVFSGNTLIAVKKFVIIR